MIRDWKHTVSRAGKGWSYKRKHLNEIELSIMLNQKSDIITVDVGKSMSIITWKQDLFPLKENVTYIRNMSDLQLSMFIDEFVLTGVQQIKAASSAINGTFLALSETDFGTEILFTKLQDLFSFYEQMENTMTDQVNALIDRIIERHYLMGTLLDINEK